MYPNEARILGQTLRDNAAFTIGSVAATVYDEDGATVGSDTTAGAPTGTGVTDAAGAGAAALNTTTNLYEKDATFVFTPSAAGEYTYKLTVALTGSETAIYEGGITVLAAPPSAVAYLDARRRLREMLDWTADPALTEEEVNTLLSDNAVATIWEAGTAYAYGDKVVPTVGNGTVWVATAAGTSHASDEPDWLSYRDMTYPIGAVGPTYRALFEDGTVTWEYNGVAPSLLWDIRAAAHAGWLLKAAKAAGRYDITYGGSNNSAKRGDVIDQCLRMADRYRPVYLL